MILRPPSSPLLPDLGFDDIPLAGLVRPALTTLKIQIAETGRKALERLVGLIGSSTDITCEVVRPELVVRASSQPIPTGFGVAGTGQNIVQTPSLEGEKL